MKVANTLFKAALLSTISVGSLGLSTVALAQDKPADSKAAGNADEEIVVTATKREKTLQDVPIAVSVASAESIEKAHVRDLNDLQMITPALRVQPLQTSTSTNFIIRGFGNGANNPGIESSVGVFIDGVYRSRSAAAISDLPNLKRVEILRGPQSTLFGKNASAGVISIVTAEPKFDFGGSAELGYGNYNAIIAKADVTGPISDTIAFSLAGGINKRDGYGTIVNTGEKSNGRDRWFTRGQLLIKPTENIKFRIIGDYDSINENCCIAGNVFDGPTGAIVRALGGNLNSNNGTGYDVYANFATTNKIDNWGGSVQGDFDMGDLSLTSITAYRGTKADNNSDSDFTSLDILGQNRAQVNNKSFTQELRLASNFDGPLNFLIGGFYGKDKITQNNQINWGTGTRAYANQLILAASGGALNTVLLENTFGALEGLPTKYAGTFYGNGQGLTEAYTLNDQSASIFGTVDFAITDRLTLTGGFNYTDDKKTYTANVTSNDVFSAVNLDSPTYAPFRYQLLYQGGLAKQVGTAMGLSGNATAAQITAFATNPLTNPTYNAINTAVTAYATANQNNAAVNPLNGIKALQFFPQYLNVPNSVENGKTADNNLSYSVRLAWKANDNINLYASYATGFKASSINLSRDSRPDLADQAALTTAGLIKVNQSYGSRLAGPEDAEVYEVGVKGKWKQAAFNLTVYQQAIKGFQSNVFTGTGFRLANAGKESAFGIEFDGSVSPIPELTFTLAMEYEKAKYDSFVGSAYGDISGQSPSGIPEISTTMGVSFKQPIGENAVLDLSSNFHYESDSPMADGGTLAAYKRTVYNVDAQIGLSLGDALHFSIWGRNLTDYHYLTTIFPSVAQSGSISGYPSMPRTYGASVRYKF